MIWEFEIGLAQAFAIYLGIGPNLMRCFRKHIILYFTIKYNWSIAPVSLAWAEFKGAVADISSKVNGC